MTAVINILPIEKDPHQHDTHIHIEILMLTPGFRTDAP